MYQNRWIAQVKMPLIVCQLDLWWSLLFIYNVALARQKHHLRWCFCVAHSWKSFHYKAVCGLSQDKYESSAVFFSALIPLLSLAEHFYLNGNTVCSVIIFSEMKPISSTCYLSNRKQYLILYFRGNYLLACIFPISLIFVVEYQ